MASLRCRKPTEEPPFRRFFCARLKRRRGSVCRSHRSFRQNRRSRRDARGQPHHGGRRHKAGRRCLVSPSDARLKRKVAPLAGALDRLVALRGVNFEYDKPDAGVHPAGVHTGFVAQEVQKVFPQGVAPGADGFLTGGPTGFEALTVELLREIAQENEVLQADNQELREHLERVGRVLLGPGVSGAK